MKIEEVHKMEEQLPLYLIMISYKRGSSALEVMADFEKSIKPDSKCVFLIVENSPIPEIAVGHEFSKDVPEVEYHHYKDKNKAGALNFAISTLIPEKEAFIICIDDDISFSPDFLLKYYEASLEKGNSYYFGTSFFVKLPQNLNRKLFPFLSGSALGKPDKEIENMKKKMFLGFSFAFYKSQWTEVKGFDERFSPGSKKGLSGQESIFQKKLTYKGYKPFLVVNNAVEHKPAPILYSKEKIIERQENNGYTHGFQNLISSEHTFKTDYMRQLAGLVKRCTVLFILKDKLSLEMKLAYTKGFFRAFLLYLRTEDKSNYLIS